MTTQKQLKIAVLGTGLMGAPIARNLQKKGFLVHAWNRTITKALPLQAEGIQVFNTPADAVRDADIIITVLKEGMNVQQVLEEAASAIRKGAILLQLSTIGVEAATSLDALAEKIGLIYYDAPVQGTKQPAELAQLVILASGPMDKRTEVQSVFDAIGKKTIWVSEQEGLSSCLKLALNSWVFSLTHGIAESLTLAKGLGIDPQLVVDVIKGGPMDSVFFQSKAAAMLSDDYTVSFSIENAVKDAQLVVDAAKQFNLQIDGANVSLTRFEHALKAGHGDKDMAATYII
ncbi:NAD(P)-dependent oxidoreductase [Xenorhabdus bovienii]|uniref:3-hydroxyisobutyrate dehydrogenase family protein n=1 Tax=Xenorhabdus bovienii str. kraussei Becker Underwood TaxID=1398204 RepID=A0A077PUH3_XENBV|nr:NAD(P)-dependent oxidoreductase [Xenorhabdus bovienii]CDH24416.1 3-hydroxyisobutyrate dehydrogenase family protein [Xenorhabdus bovienii str. kraussei Becker Underwood]